MNSDIIQHMLEVQDRVTNTLHRVQHQSTMDRYMNNLKTCMGNSTEEFSFRILLVENMASLTISNPKEIYLKKEKEISLNSFTLSI